MSEHQPRLSVILIVNTPARQLLNTLYSLCAPYQWNVCSSDYEVIVVGCTDKKRLDEKSVEALADNIHYHPMTEVNASALSALDYGLAKAQGEFIGLMMEGASIVSPRVIEYALMGLLMNPKTLVIVPSYHIGQKEKEARPEYSEHDEEVLLGGARWREDGYRLFAVSAASEETPRGFFHPMIESNGLFFAADRLEPLAEMARPLQSLGTWGLKLYLYRTLALLPDTLLTVLIGEGCFKQCIAEPAASVNTQWNKDMSRQLEQLKMLWGGEFKAVCREPLCLGAVSSYAQPHLRYSSQMAVRRFKRLERGLQPPWVDDSEM